MDILHIVKDKAFLLTNWQSNGKMQHSTIEHNGICPNLYELTTEIMVGFPLFYSSTIRTVQHFYSDVFPNTAINAA